MGGGTREPRQHILATTSEAGNLMIPQETDMAMSVICLGSNTSLGNQPLGSAPQIHSIAFASV